MFARLINKAKSAASGVVSKYVARALVGIPFGIAAAFAFAAIVVMLEVTPIFIGLISLRRAKLQELPTSIVS